MFEKKCVESYLEPVRFWIQAWLKEELPKKEERSVREVLAKCRRGGEILNVKITFVLFNKNWSREPESKELVYWLLSYRQPPSIGTLAREYEKMSRVVKAGKERKGVYFVVQPYLKKEEEKKGEKRRVILRPEQKGTLKAIFREGKEYRLLVVEDVECREEIDYHGILLEDGDGIVFPLELEGSLALCFDDLRQYVQEERKKREIELIYS